jgi:hypothetical protein
MRSTPRPSFGLLARALTYVAVLAGLAAGRPSKAQAPASPWRAAIDAYWGPGAPAAEQLAAFDAYWAQADARFAAFASAPVDWDAQRARYRPEIEAGVSRGRFAAILNHLALSLREAHTYALDPVVNVETAPAPGVPLLHGAVRRDAHFGACLTPLPDSTLLVYAVAPVHPLGLVPGDVVVGYDGTPWRALYRQLLAAELPLAMRDAPGGGDPPYWTRSAWRAAPSAYAHGWLSAAGMNWHLFTGLDVVRGGSGVAERVPVAPLAGADLSVRCTEQVAVPGVAFPVPSRVPGGPPIGAGEFVSWGFVEGTRVGYVYVWSWTGFGPVVSEDFRQAIETFTTDPTVEGIIVDFRFNDGGWVPNADGGLSLLFSEATETLEMLQRSGPDDRLALEPLSSPVGGLPVPGGAAAAFDRPIAVLTGPGAYSAGDFNAVRLLAHPRARSFGKTTAGAFTPGPGVTLPPGYSGTMAFLNARRVDAPGALLVHAEQTPDEEVWLSTADVAAGEDTVVRRALDWIAASVADEPSPPGGVLVLSVVSPNPVSRAATVRLDLPTGGPVRASLYDVLGREVAVVFDGSLPAGRHPLALSAAGLASGPYVLRVLAGGRSASRRVTVVR